MNKLKKWFPYITIILVIILTISLIIIDKKNKTQLSLDDQMIKYCEQIYKNENIGDKEIYISLKTMKEKYNLDISAFEKEEHNCSLENSMAKAYMKNGQIVCSVNLICENK